MLESMARDAARVLIASADASFRNALLTVVSQVRGVTVVGFIRAVEQVSMRTIVSAPALLLLDAHLGVDENQIAALLTKLPYLHVIVCATSGDPSSTQTLARDGRAIRNNVIFVQSGRSDRFCELRAILTQLYEPRMREPRRTAQDRELPQAPTAALLRKRKPQVMVVASSTGGPSALTALFRALPGDFPLPIAVVQHMPPGFTNMLANRLNDTCSLEVLEAEAGMQVVPGRILIGPGNHHLLLSGKPGNCHAELNQQQPEHSCRPAANVLFRSAVAVYGGSVLTVVLTGMGRDGFEGAQQLHQLGARVIVQDAATSTVWGMPGAIAQAGFADAILPLHDIASELTRNL